MRKACSIILLAALVAIILPASGMTDLEYWVEDHNTICYTTSAKEITGIPKVDESGEITQYIYDVTDHIRYVFVEKNGEIVAFCCKCLDETETAEFLAQCVTGCLSFCGIDNGLKCYDPILYQFTSARGGHETEYCLSIPGVAFRLEKLSYGYSFLLMKEKKK